MNPLTLIQLLGQDEFLAGFGWGLVGAAAIVFAPKRWRPIPAWGVIVGVCVIGAASPFVGPRFTLVLGVGLAVLGSELAKRGHAWAWIAVWAGAISIGLLSSIPDVWWVRLGTTFFVVAGGWLIDRMASALDDTGIAPLMFAGTAFGVWATVPDTEIAAAFLGVLTPMTLTAWPQVRSVLGAGGAYALTGVLAWTIAEGGAARAGSIIGGWGTIGAFIGAVFVTQLLAERRWFLFGVHGVAVLLASRVAGMFEMGSAALVVVVPVLVMAAAATRFLAVATPHSPVSRP